MPEAHLVEETALGSPDLSSSDSDGAPKRPQRPRHGRSLSHPFPSLFSSSRRKKQKSAISGNLSDDSDDDCGQVPGLPRMPQHVVRGKQGNNGNRDFATGNCMLCGSLVRWPRGLPAFKCTVCLTVNDLPLADQEMTRGASGPASQQPRGGGPETASTISRPGMLPPRPGLNGARVHPMLLKF